MANRMKLTTVIGTFYFDTVQSHTEMKDHKDGRGSVLTTVVVDVPLSHMKLVRDAVVAKVLNPKLDGERRLTTTKAIYEYPKNRLAGPASGARFLFIPAPGYWIKQGVKQLMGKQHRNVPRMA